MRAALYIIERDFRHFFRFKWWVIVMLVMTLSDLFIMAVVFTGMVNPEIISNYFLFFSPGITITALFASAFMIGREVNAELRREVLHYLLSLPIKRWQLAFGRVLAGGLRGMVYTTPLLIITLVTALVLTGNSPSPLQILVILAILFLVSIGTSGLSIALSLYTGSFEKYATVRGVVYYMFFFCSTVFYPLSLVQEVMPQPLVIIARHNPLSCGADIIRFFLIGSPALEAFAFLNLVSFASSFALLTTFTYVKIIQK